MMKVSRIFAAGCVVGFSSQLFAQPVAVPKTNPIPLYIHYMPWFQTPETLGANNWGLHWKMNTRNPNIIDSNGQREIASHYYPLIGPYDSTDQYVIEYHMLLMKLSGIDGVIVDWYGTNGTNGDINSLLTASNTIVNKTANYGLKFGVTLEDRFAASTSDVTANINYLRQNYYTQSNYIRTGASNSPLTLVFGPTKFQQSSDWDTILSGPGEKPALLALPNQSGEIGASNAAGEFSWVFQDANTSDHLTVQQNFLKNRAPQVGTALGVAYPGYNDYYAQGGEGAGNGFIIPENNGQTLTDTLALDKANSNNISGIQLATWNDFGEGTMLEPTVEEGFTSLEAIQQFTGVTYGLSQLELVYQLYEARQEFLGNAQKEALLDQASNDINQLDFADAQATINQVTGVPEPATLPLLAVMSMLMYRRRANFTDSLV